MYGNELGPEGGAAIAEALKVNKTVTTIKYVPHAPLIVVISPHRALLPPHRGNTATPTHFALGSLSNNRLGPGGGAAIAEALKVNKTVTTIECVPRHRLDPHRAANPARFDLLPPR